ncbi:glycoside hydrolase superfamily [Umbelopsis sp. AD052]|nr:glycoside hydrolase superfamily [Umbelopsis sp. AD052]
MVSLKLLSLLLAPLAAIAHEAANSHGGQFVLTPSSGFSIDTLLADPNKYDEENAHVKQFGGGDTLAYVTPWNNHGYDVVKQFKGKFDFVSPVWYYVERGSNGDFVLNGGHDVDRGWMDEVRDIVDNRKVGRIVPRFQFRGWTREHLQEFVKSPQDAGKLAHLITHEVEKQAFDGIVLECGYPAFFATFLQKLSVELHQINRVLISVLPPVRDDVSKEIMSADAFKILAQFVDRFSLMSYDYSSGSYEGGPSSPIDWIEDNIEHLTNEENRHQLLVGINMFGMAYQQGENPQPMVMNSIIGLLREMHEQGSTLDLVWDKEAEEHSVDISEDDGLTEGPTVWFPTPKYIKNRIHLAEDWGVGLSLWEVGQGLDSFYDAF